MITATSRIFSYAVDEVSSKLLSSFLECEVLIVAPDLHDFKFSIKAAERKGKTEDSTHIHEFSKLSWEFDQ